MNPILIVSTGRTGGSICTGLLQTSPDILCTDIWPYERKPACVALKTRSIPETGHPGEPLQDMSLQPGFTRASLASEIYTVYKKRGCYPFFVEKIPYHYRNTMVDAFPEAVTIMLIRDPRDVMRSAAKFFSSKYTSDERSGLVTRLLSGRAGVYWRNFGSVQDRYYRAGGTLFTVRYEDLVSDPEGEALRIFSRLEVKGNPEDVAAFFRLRATHPGHSTNSSPLSSVGAWRGYFTQKESNQLTSAFSATLDRLGYER